MKQGQWGMPLAGIMEFGAEPDLDMGGPPGGALHPPAASAIARETC